MDQQKKVETLKNELEIAKMDMDEMKKKIDKLNQEKGNMRKLQKETEEQVTKYKTQYMPKLKETIKF